MYTLTIHSGDRTSGTANDYTVTLPAVSKNVPMTAEVKVGALSSAARVATLWLQCPRIENHLQTGAHAGTAVLSLHPEATQGTGVILLQGDPGGPLHVTWRDADGAILTDATEHSINLVIRKL